MMDARRAEKQTGFTTAAPEGHASTTSYVANQMDMTDDDYTVCYDVQMPLAQGRELLQLIKTLSGSPIRLSTWSFSACNTNSAPQSIS